MNSEIFSETDIAMTRRALELALLGAGRVSPSPLVGCVITDKNGDVAGEGSYLYENVTHAEVIALKEAGERARGGTAYVSLEPHSYHGRTKPCTDALIEAGIVRVVCPVEDPNPLVSGQGFALLRERGIEVVTGVLRDQAARINEKFCVWHNRRRPFVQLKLAISIDGRISLRSSVSTALSGEESSRRVQLLRHEHDAILVGGSTALVDNPSLTDRSGLPRRRPLVRVVLDNRLRIPLDGTLVSTARETPTLVITGSKEREKIERLRTAGVDVAETDARDLLAVLEELRKRELQSVLVEGGTAIAGAFRDAGIIDKATFIIAPLIIGGVDAPVAIGGKGAKTLAGALRLDDIVVGQHGNDLEVTGYPSVTAA